LSESWVYRSAWGYGLALRVLDGRYYTARDTAVAALVPFGSSVLEPCCGPARLYLRELRSRTSSYVGIDANTGLSLDTLMGGFGDAVRSTRLIPGGREKVYVLDPT
jgi:hypothetical protein